MRLLLIQPKFPESFWSFSWAFQAVTTDKRAVSSPLGLATLAALTPDDWEVTICDENVESIDWSAEVDMVGVCGMGVQFPRQQEILRHFRARGIYTVCGGSYASLCPEYYTHAANTVISGEAERIWPRFCADFTAGTPQPMYREEAHIDLAHSPLPRYDLLKLDRYQKVAIQFSRGCPFSCEFCDIIVMFGRTPRTKALAQIGAELDCLRRHNIRSLFFVDDNLIGNRQQAKKLLAFLADYQDRHAYRFSFGTEASINMVGDAELLRLFQRAHFEWVFIGIETPSLEGLREANKGQNLRQDLLTSIRTIYAHGIDIFAGFIVGFDTDDDTIFDRQYDFIVQSGITMAMVGLLTAMPKTPLYERLRAAGRLHETATTDNTRPATNVIPLRMTTEALVAGYQSIHRRLVQERITFQRIRNKVRHLRAPVVSSAYGVRQKLRYLRGLLQHGILPGGPRRIYYFCRSLALALRRPRVFPIVIADWICAMALQAFVHRHFDHSTAQTEQALQKFQRALAQRVAEWAQQGWIASRLAVLKDRAQIWIDLTHPVDQQLRRALARAIRKTLKSSGEIIVLDCRRVSATGAEHLGLLLRKLRRYHQQISVYVSETLYRELRDELAPFDYNLVNAVS